MHAHKLFRYQAGPPMKVYKYPWSPGSIVTWTYTGLFLKCTCMSCKTKRGVSLYFGSVQSQSPIVIELLIPLWYQFVHDWIKLVCFVSIRRSQVLRWLDQAWRSAGCTTDQPILCQQNISCGATCGLRNIHTFCINHHGITLPRFLISVPCFIYVPGYALLHITELYFILRPSKKDSFLSHPEFSKVRSRVFHSISYLIYFLYVKTTT